jgi:putative N6-adenine-specific DNA methylase
MQKNNKILIKTLFGLENILKSELENIGIKNVNTLNRAVDFDGSIEDLYKCNLLLRTALAVYLRVGSDKVTDQNQLYDFINSIKWDEHFSKDKTIAVEAFSNSNTLTHSQFVERKTKDAIVDYFRDNFGSRPDVDIKRPDVKIYVHINNDICNVFLNSSGTPLYYRGYNKRIGIAPLNDILAAGIIKMSNWDGSIPLYDPMCGSGTILSEAYMIANKIPPTIFREYFSFKNWKNYDSSLWFDIKNNAKQNIENNNPVIFGSDLNKKILSDTKINLERVDAYNKIKLFNADFLNSEPPCSDGLIITNPPYGIRISNEDINDFYKKIGDVLKFKYAGFSAWIISSELSAIKLIGLKPDKKISLFNGQLEAKLHKYSIYRGSKKI